MKDKIIEQSIISLQQEGLRFSIDTLAEKLKISKKTIYKYFPAKETLAYEIYKKYYADLTNKINNSISFHKSTLPEELLLCYFDSARMVRKEIFNKYCLNNVIGNFALEQHQNVWNTIQPFFCANMSDDAATTFKLIIDGAFDQAIACNADSVLLIRMLREIK